jgi:hypothetical protein
MNKEYSSSVVADIAFIIYIQRDLKVERLNDYERIKGLTNVGLENSKFRMTHLQVVRALIIIRILVEVIGM